VATPVAPAPAPPKQKSHGLRILAIAFIALVLWIAWLVASVAFGAHDGLTGSKLGGGQEALLVTLFVSAIALTLVAVVMILFAPFRALRRRRRLSGR
jgi:hypothetical protein